MSVSYRELRANDPGRQSSLSCGVEATLDSVRVERQMRVREKRVGEKLKESYIFISIIHILSQKRHRDQLTRIYICRGELISPVKGKPVGHLRCRSRPRPRGRTSHKTTAEHSIRHRRVCTCRLDVILNCFLIGTGWTAEDSKQRKETRCMESEKEFPSSAPHRWIVP